MLILKNLEDEYDLELKITDNMDETGEFPVYVGFIESGMEKCIGLSKTQTLELIEELKGLIA